MTGRTRLVFFVDWDREFINFLKGVTLSPSLRGHIIVHIFYPQDISQVLLPNYKPWLFKHPSPKETKGGSWKNLEDYAMKFKFSADYSLTANTLATTANNSEAGKERVYVISKSNERSERLAKVIETEFGVDVRADNNKCMTLLDFVEFKCETCMIAFKERKERISHDKDFHSLVCFNPECMHRTKEHSFSSESELRQHLSRQMKCQFCPGRVFCSKEMLDQHLKNTHKKCSCPCGEYFGNRQTYLDHFFSYYPSPNAIAVPGKEPSPKKKGNSQFSKAKADQRKTDGTKVDVQNNNSIRSSSVASTISLASNESRNDGDIDNRTAKMADLAISPVDVV